jgi:hypothetical protein
MVDLGAHELHNRMIAKLTLERRIAVGILAALGSALQDTQAGVSQ